MVKYSWLVLIYLPDWCSAPYLRMFQSHISPVYDYCNIIVVILIQILVQRHHVFIRRWNYFRCLHSKRSLPGNAPNQHRDSVLRNYKSNINL